MQTIVLMQRDHEASPHLRELINGTGRFEVVALCHTVAEGRDALARHRPDLLMTDLRVQDGDVTGLLKEVREAGARRRPHVLVTIVAHDDAALMTALRAGGDGYWVHASSSDLLIATLDQLARGESPISPMIARQVLDHFEQVASHTFETNDLLDPLRLTGPEREMLQRLAQGYLIDEIAVQWHASVHSLACGIRRVYQKLQFDLQARGLTFA